jgi:hypothetical protein
MGASGGAELALTLATLAAFNEAISNLRRNAQNATQIEKLPDEIKAFFRELDVQLEIAQMETGIAGHIERLKEAML